MIIDQTIIDHFKTEEGYRTTSYVDTVGVATIGIGHALGKGSEYENITWTDDQVMITFQQDVNKATQGVIQIFPQYETFSQGLQLALLDMCFELGEHGLSQFVSMIKYINEGNFQEAANDALNSLWARQVPARSHRDAALIAAGSIVTPPAVPVAPETSTDNPILDFFREVANFVSTTL